MVTIPQHGRSGTLNDLAAFIADLEPLQRQVDFWAIHIEECIGPASIALTELTASNPHLTPLAFANLCCSVDQTIDGEFIAYMDGSEVVRLRAEDSSFWEITGPSAFEAHMLSTYGAYEG